MIRTDKYPYTPTQKATAERHADRRRGKPMTQADEDRVQAAAQRRARRHRAAD